jgi:hypothetical protein
MRTEAEILSDIQALARTIVGPYTDAERAQMAALKTDIMLINTALIITGS